MANITDTKKKEAEEKKKEKENLRTHSDAISKLYKNKHQYDNSGNTKR